MCIYRFICYGQKYGVNIISSDFGSYEGVRRTSPVAADRGELEAPLLSGRTMTSHVPHDKTTWMLLRLTFLLA